MKNAISLLGIALLLVGVGLLVLTNTGLISLRKPYIVRKSAELEPAGVPVALVDVNVVPMDGERVLEDQTVLVRDGLIERIGDAGDVAVPADALLVEAKGKYLMPGLVDMHVHIQEENNLLLFVANGVTTVRNTWGRSPQELSRWFGVPDQLALREQIKRGALFGPTIYTSGPVMEGRPATTPMMLVFETPEQAAESVAWQAAQGYDFVKVYDHLTPETYQAILEGAREYDLPVIGHVPVAVGLEGVLAGGQLSIEHLTGYIDPDTAEFSIPETELAHFAELTRDAGIWNCPTIGIYQTAYVLPEEMAAADAKRDMVYVSPRMRYMLKYLFLPGIMQGHTYEGADYRARIDEIYTEMTAALHEAGAKIVLGTDTLNPYLVPGFSVHEELGHLVEAGFTPYEAIEAGTRNAAEALGALDEFGTVTKGKRADLLLVEGNPLEDVENVGQRAGVMLRGHWLPEAQLRGLLHELADSYAPTLVDRLWPLIPIGLGLGLLLWRRLGV